MKNLKFILKTEEKYEINEETNYYIKENVIKFKINNTIYEYDIDKYILIKKDKDILEMHFKENEIIIHIQENNLKFTLPIKNVIIKEKDNRVEISYEIEEETDIKKYIIIEY